MVKLGCVSHNRMLNVLCNVQYDILLKIGHLRLLHFASDEYAAYSLRTVKTSHLHHKHGYLAVNHAGKSYVSQYAQ